MEIGIIIRASRVEPQTIEFARSLMRGNAYTVFLALDERTDIWDTFEIPKLSISNSTVSDLGLPVEGLNFAWQCGDYALYLAFEHSPSLSRFWLVEEDVYINLPDPIAFFEQVDQVASDDLLVTNLEVADSGWFWYNATSRFYDRVFRCLFPVVRVSRNALTHLLAERRGHEQLLRSGKINANQIPNDEGFVASSLAQGTFTTTDLNRIADFYTQDSFSYGDLINARLVEGKSVLYHPVASGADYVRRLARNNRTSISSILKASLADPLISLADLRPEIERRLVSSLLQDPEQLTSHDQDDGLGMITRTLQDSLLLQEMTISSLSLLGRTKTLTEVVGIGNSRMQALRNTKVNLAFGKPADQSSTCVWSRKADKRLDASLLVNGQTHVGLYNHTDDEVDPWWQVDLSCLYEITGIVVHGRKGFEDRSHGLRALISSDGVTWEVVFEHTEAKDPDAVLAIDLSSPRMTRYVKLVIPGKAILSLMQVQVLSGLL